MIPELRSRVRSALERPHRLGMIGGDLEDQLAHCAAFLEVVRRLADLDDPGAGIDLGSGGGIPGIYLAAASPAWSWRLVEMRTSRAAEVERAALRLGLSTIVDTRPAQLVAHDPVQRECADVVTARAFGPPDLVAECAAGLVRVGGVVIVSEPPAPTAPSVGTDGQRWPIEALDRLGFDAPRFEQADRGHFVVLHKSSPTPSTIPRRPPRADRGWPL